MENMETTDELLADLGEQLRAQRLRANLTLDDVAKKTGMSINAVRRLESGEGSTLSSFVSVLKALQRESWLHTLRPAVTVSPLDMLKQRAPRQRAFRPRVSKDKPTPAKD
jgi:transcriptional regulator with XRE-family HTH domain